MDSNKAKGPKQGSYSVFEVTKLEPVRANNGQFRLTIAKEGKPVSTVTVQSFPTFFDDVLDGGTKRRA